MHLSPAEDPPQRIASRLHLAVLLWVFLWGFFSQGRSLRSILTAGDSDSFQFRVLCCYVLVFTWEWVQLWYVWFGIRKSGMSLRKLIGGRWNTFGSIAKDFGLGLALWLVWMIGINLYARFSPFGSSDQHTRDLVVAMVPRTGLEVTLWIFLSLAAGFCEEIVFRGYLLRQFQAMSNNAPVAVLAQALVFGAVHSYQGINGMIVIFFFGLTLGSLAVWRQSLRPGIITHALYDALIGVVMYLAFLFHQSQ